MRTTQVQTQRVEAMTLDPHDAKWCEFCDQLAHFIAIRMNCADIEVPTYVCAIHAREFILERRSDGLPLRVRVAG